MTRLGGDSVHGAHAGGALDDRVLDDRVLDDTALEAVGVVPTPRGAIPPRSSAVVVGLLFIAATVLFVVGQTIYSSILDAPDFLSLAYPERGRLTAGLLVELMGILAIPLIALLIYPVLRTHDETAALAYVGLRILESTALVVMSGLN